MPEITMPRLSDTMEEGTLAAWLKQPGEQVQRGDVLAEIETDKATMELEAFEEGVLQQLLVQEGETVPIGQPIAVIGTGTGDGGAAAPAAAPAEVAAAPTPAEEASRIETAPEVEIPAATPAEAPAQPAPAAAGERVKASPMARAVARDRGIDLAGVAGSGPGGRVVKADVEAAAAGDGGRPAPAAPPPPVAAQPAPSVDVADVEEVPLTNMRKTVARRLVESMQSAPHFYLTIQIDADPLLGFRAELNQRLADQGIKLSVNDLLVKACAVTVRAHPDINVSWAGDKILRHRRVHVGIAVAVGGGLIVPVVRDADQKSVSQISREAKALIDKARAGRLLPDEYTGGTFTISNLGMFGIDQFTAVINPPEAAILAVGATTTEPVVRKKGKVATRQRMKLTLSIDHRALDGATGAQFLADLKAVLEEPLRILA